MRGSTEQGRCLTQNQKVGIVVFVLVFQRRIVFSGTARSVAGDIDDRIIDQYHIEALQAEAGG